MSRFRAFTTALGFKPSGGMSRSSSDQSSTPSIPHRPVSMSSLRPLYGNFTLYLRVHSARNLSAVAQGSYCKLYLGDEPIIGGFGQGKSLVGADKKQGGSHQTFHTKVQMSAMRDCPEWNEKFQMNVKNPNAEILTIRVKNHVLIYSPAIGACVVYLRQLQLGETIDEWFPLYKNDKPSGEIRLQICMQENAKLAVPERRYSQASEETIQRLMLEHRELGEAQRRELELQQEEKWRKMEEDAIKHAGLEQQIEREEKWREQCASKLEHEQKQQEKEENSDSELPSSFKYRGVKKEEDVATQKMENLSLQTAVEESNQREVNFGRPVRSAEPKDGEPQKKATRKKADNPTTPAMEIPQSKKRRPHQEGASDVATAEAKETIPASAAEEAKDTAKANAATECKETATAPGAGSVCGCCRYGRVDS
ncbi:hypothetical protein JG687_00006262 [Phytophthora cactorum]|uniref:C2 domain-containing protein n=2 Tax=Phytophthora cactorum TaxID=29920 RepID=A0A8T1UNG8_9STRA|nr:hypothetical protein JG687_00006262 [Phytophthora cactorum]